VEDTVTIVSGLPRSGTSMMMQMLDASGMPVLTDEFRQPDEDNPKGYYEYEAVKTTATDPSWVHNAGGKVVKMVYRLLYDLPKDRRYKVVFMKRDLAEVIRSQEVMLDRHGQSGGPLDDARLAEIYDRQLREARAWLGAQSNFDVLYVDYHDVLHNTGRVVHDLNEFLGGNLNTEAMLQVPDAGLYRQRR
jgi:Sulfotransferase domain